MLEKIAHILLAIGDFKLAQQCLLGMVGDTHSRGVGESILNTMLNEVALHECVFTHAQFGASFTIIALIFKDFVKLSESEIVVIMVDKTIYHPQEHEHIVFASDSQRVKLFYEVNVGVVFHQLFYVVE